MSKYYIIKNKDMATCLKVLTQQEPYVYKNRYEEGRLVWSFVNDEKFQEMFILASKCVANKNK